MDDVITALELANVSLDKTACGHKTQSRTKPNEFHSNRTDVGPLQQIIHAYVQTAAPKSA